MDIDPLDIVKGQQSQADKIDHWACYQARNLREELAKAAAVQLRLQSDGQPAMGSSPHPGGLVALLT